MEVVEAQVQEVVRWELLGRGRSLGDCLPCGLIRFREEAACHRWTEINHPRLHQRQRQMARWKRVRIQSLIPIVLRSRLSRFRLLRQAGYQDTHPLPMRLTRTHRPQKPRSRITVERHSVQLKVEGVVEPVVVYDAVGPLLLFISTTTQAPHPHLPLRLSLRFRETLGQGGARRWHSASTRDLLRS